jgi:hypothetical protein
MKIEKTEYGQFTITVNRQFIDDVDIVLECLRRRDVPSVSAEECVARVQQAVRKVNHEIWVLQGRPMATETISVWDGLKLMGLPSDVVDRNEAMAKELGAMMNDSNQMVPIRELKELGFQLDEVKALVLFIDRYKHKSLHTLKLGVKYASEHFKDPFTFWAQCDEWMDSFPETTTL